MHKSNETLPAQEIAQDLSDYHSPLPDNPYVRQFSDSFYEKVRSENLRSIIGPRSEAAEAAITFAGNEVNDTALGIAPYAHILEHFTDDILRRNIAQTLRQEFPESPEDIPVDKRYTLGILFDIAEVRIETKDLIERNKDIDGPILDHKVLTRLAKTTDLESVIVSASSHIAEFTSLIAKRESESDWTETDNKRIHHLAQTIRSVDSILLELTGFDAFAASSLSPVYTWDLDKRGRGESVRQAQQAIAELGGYECIAYATDDFLEKLFRDHAISEVTTRQIASGLRYTDGVGDISSSEEQLPVRVLTRLKSIGSLAQKIDNSPDRDIPADIIGLSIVVDEFEEVAPTVNAVLGNLDAANIDFVCAPSRHELIHIKGSADFLDSIREKVNFESKSFVCEQSDNGYEAVKITLSHHYHGVEYPIEIQITHDVARKNSRYGMASHTVFKLSKLFDLDVSQEELEQIAIDLSEINERKQALLKKNQHLCDESNSRVDRFLEQKSPSFGLLRAMGRSACTGPISRV